MPKKKNSYATDSTMESKGVCSVSYWQPPEIRMVKKLYKMIRWVFKNL